LVTIDYCLSVSSDCSLAISLTISFVSSHFPFPFGCFGISCHTFLAIFSSSCDAMLGSYIMYFSSCFALVLWMQSKDSCCELLCAVSRILVLQLCDLLLPTLLNDGVYFALILEEFLGNVLHDRVEKRERQRCGRSCRQKQNVEDNEFTELNALVGSEARFR
jgi:hypothetical protein